MNAPRWWRRLTVTLKRLPAITVFRGGVAALLLALIGGAALFSPENRAILPQLLVNAVITGSLYALVSAGLALTWGVLRVINFAHGHLMMLGAYLFYWASESAGYSVAPATFLTGALSLLLGWICYQVFVAPFLHLSSVLTIVTTLALSTILEAAVSLMFGVNVRAFTLGNGLSSLDLFGVYITPIQIGIIIGAVLILLLLGVVMHQTATGRRLRAFSENTVAAESLGASAGRTSVSVFLVGMLLTVFAGVMIGFETNLQPTMGHSYTIKAFAAMILGGLGNIWGTVAGAYFLGLVENLGVGLDLGPATLPAGYKEAFAYVIILAVLLVRQEGLVGSQKRRG